MMFCYQCEETVKGTGCTVKGVCGKDDEIAAYHDVLIYLCKGISVRNLAAMEKRKGNPDAGLFIAEALFATLTNVNFDKDRFTAMINKAVAIRDAMPVSGVTEPDACTWRPESENDILGKAETVGILSTTNEDVRSLRSTLLFGLKGISAYYTHAAVLGKTDAAITTFIQKGLAATLQDLAVPDLVALVLECGKVGVNVLALLDAANTSAYGKPEVTSVKTTVGKYPGILITGHDLKDLEMLLEQSEDSGVDVYTHGEMLPAHAYPSFKKYPHLHGNYGGSWWRQKEEFEQFNGPVLFTTNCLVPPKDSYKSRLFTTGLTRLPGRPAHRGWPEWEEGLFQSHCVCQNLPAPKSPPGEWERTDYGLCPRCSSCDGGQGRWSGKERGHQAVYRHGRVRWEAEGTGVLYRVCQSAPQRHGHPYRRLRQVPVQCARSGDHRGDPTCPGCRPVQ
jgi:hydroxylamine reductase